MIAFAIHDYSWMDSTLAIAENKEDNNRQWTVEEGSGLSHISDRRSSAAEWETYSRGWWTCPLPSSCQGGESIYRPTDVIKAMFGKRYKLLHRVSSKTCCAPVYLTLLLLETDASWNEHGGFKAGRRVGSEEPHIPEDYTHSGLQTSRFLYVLKLSSFAS